MERKRTAEIEKIIMGQQNKTSFLAGTKTTIIDNVEEPLCVNEPYYDEWRNPAMIRGVPSSQDEYNLSLRDRKPYFIKKLERPYYIRSEGNKSATLSNDLFDVMYEAEQYGGSAQRHLGTQLGLTKTFGIPDSADSTHNDEVHNYYKMFPSMNTSIRLGETTANITRKSSTQMKPIRTRNILLEDDSDDEQPNVN